MKTLFIAAVLMALPLSGARAVPADSIYNDSPVQCGATYFLYWKGFEENKQAALAEAYRRKFESLYTKAMRILETRGLNKETADAYIQDHVNTLYKVADRDTKTFAEFKMLCDKRFPDL